MTEDELNILFTTHGLYTVRAGPMLYAVSPAYMVAFSSEFSATLSKARARYQIEMAMIPFLDIAYHKERISKKLWDYKETIPLPGGKQDVLSPRYEHFYDEEKTSLDDAVEHYADRVLRGIHDYNTYRKEPVRAVVLPPVNPFSTPFLLHKNRWRSLQNTEIRIADYGSPLDFLVENTWPRYTQRGVYVQHDGFSIGNSQLQLALPNVKGISGEH